VEPDTVIVSLNVLEDHPAGLLVGGWHVTGKTLGFERAPERFHHGVVVAVGPAAHAGDGADFFEQLPVGPAGVLAAAVAVNDEAWPGPAALPGLVQAPADQTSLRNDPSPPLPSKTPPVALQKVLLE